MKKLIIAAFLVLPILLSAENSDSAKFYMAKSEKFSTERLWKQASESAEKALMFDSGKVEIYLKNADLFERIKNLYKAGKTFELAYKRFPTNTQVLSGLARHYSSNRQYKKAADILTVCNSCQDRDKQLGAAYFNMDEFAKAEKHLLAHVAANPNDADAIYMLAKNYTEMELMAKAVEWQEKAVAADPSNAKKKYELGVLNFNLQKYPQALSNLLAAKENGYPSSIEFDEQLGYMYIYNGKYDEGEKLILNIFERKPGYLELVQDIAALMYEQKQYDRSLFLLQKVLTNNPNNAQATYQAGLNFLKKGDKNRGQALCDKAIELDPKLASLRQEKRMPF